MVIKPLPQKDYGKRRDGKPKGPGFLGPVTAGKDTMTELTIGLPIRQADGTEVEMDVPTMVPTLTPAELNYLKANRNRLPGPGHPIFDVIAGKAKTHAEERIASGQSPFIEAGQRARVVGLKK